MWSVLDEFPDDETSNTLDELIGGRGNAISSVKSSVDGSVKTLFTKPLYMYLPLF